ncbi:MAG: hypothetical protein DHS20C11_05100 [Lysobacteraceae bacterium]|nr:MAG: hypothetical protein DHS20C11_05100 [Xanthomonadaceae bacterium]
MKLSNSEKKELALSLLRADSTKEVINLLYAAGLWQNKDLWRLYGDKEGNFAQVGNQQQVPEAALVEKAINSVDARLMRECLRRGIDPQSEAAPSSVRDAVAKFYEGKESPDDEAGVISQWSKKKRGEEGKNITIAATGAKPRNKKGHRMCLTITDLGEGQSARRLPNTILSLNEKNKQRIPFVQGKFNMGGSGALRFCEGGIQLVISRRDPALAAMVSDDDTASEWGVTVVRREEPSNRAGEPRHSEYTYLAPVNAAADPRHGDVLSFTADSLPILPEGNHAYKRGAKWGTAIKLYEYETANCGQSNILMKDGLLFALERLMPEIALPLTLHECRNYGGKDGSYSTPLAGLAVRLEAGKGDNLEEGFPKTAKISTAGMEMKARIYAFKSDKAATYLKNEGVIFAINGQAHGHLPKSIFYRKSVDLPRLKDSLLVLVDCSKLKVTEREDLFMSSRDRLSQHPIRKRLEKELEVLLRENHDLAKLQNERRRKEVEDKLSDEKPLEEVLGRVLKASPTLNQLFLKGQRLSKPFNRAGKGDGDGKLTTKDKARYEGKRHPTYFRIPKHAGNKIYERNCEYGRRIRVDFETDVEDEYFSRSTDAGTLDLEIVDSSSDDLEAPDFSFSLGSGIAHLSMNLPADAEVGDFLTICVTVADPTLVQPFVNTICLTVTQKSKHKGGSGKRLARANSGPGAGSGDRGIQLPEVIEVREGDDCWKQHRFSHESACKIISDPIVGEDGETQYSHVFYINLSNNSLQNDMKYSRQDPRIIEAKFKYGMVLLGLGMLHQASEDAKRGEEDESINDAIDKATRAIAPVLIAIIDQLGGLDESTLEALDSGDDD